MKIEKDRFGRGSVGFVLAVLMGVVWACAPQKSQSPVAEASATSEALRSLPRYTGAKKRVFIAELESVAPQMVSTRAATNMMTTALVESGAFAVVEPDDVPAAPSKHGGRAQAAPYDYILKGKVSEANAGASADKTHLTVGGMESTADQNADGIGIDVRIIDVKTREVVDSVNVRKAIQAKNSETKGIGKMLGKWVKEVRKADADLDTSHSAKEGSDAALRACIEQAVLELAQHLVLNPQATNKPLKAR
jgi:curli biogenesis system outer membrane secretion channel CsgG